MKKTFIFVLIAAVAASMTFTSCSSKLDRVSTAASSTVYDSQLSSVAQDSAAQPDSSEPAVSYASTDSSGAVSSVTSTAAASGASAIKTGVVKSGLTVTAPAKAPSKATAPGKTSVSPAKPSTASKAPVKTSTGTASKPATKPASKPSTTTSSKPASNPYAGYTAWVDTHNQDIAPYLAKGSPRGYDTDLTPLSQNVQDNSTAPWDLGYAYDMAPQDYALGCITFDQLKAKYTKTYQVAQSSKHKYIVTAIYQGQVNYTRGNPASEINQVKNSALFAKKYTGLYFQECIGTTTGSNIKVGTAYMVTFLLKQIS